MAKSKRTKSQQIPPPDPTGGPNGPGLPKSVTGWLRDIFSKCNQRITDKLCNNPNAPEETFDLTWIEHLSEYSAPTQIDDAWVVRIDAHYLGGLRHFMSWEIADIGLLLFVRRHGALTTRKVAILQSKRLYPTNQLVREERRIDYEIGFARIADPEDLARSIASSTRFDFNEACEYGALSAGSEQSEAIDTYLKQNQIAVHYQFYNPSSVPFAVHVPLEKRLQSAAAPQLGVRVMRAVDVHRVLGSLRKGQHPSLAQLMKVNDYAGLAGWSLQDFVVDLFLGCREGTHFRSLTDQKMYNLFNRRSGPISAAIAITIEEIATTP
jgi:hypothetical protein